VEIEVGVCSKCGLPTRGDEYVNCPVHGLVGYYAPPATKCVEVPDLPTTVLVGAHLSVASPLRLWHCVGCGAWVWFPTSAEGNGSRPYCIPCDAKGRGLRTMVPTDVVRTPDLP